MQESKLGMYPYLKKWEKEKKKKKKEGKLTKQEK